MSSTGVAEQMDKWEREFKERMRARGLPYRSRPETSSSYRAGCKRDSAFLAREKLDQ